MCPKQQKYFSHFYFISGINLRNMVCNANKPWVLQMIYTSTINRAFHSGKYKNV